MVDRRSTRRSFLAASGVGLAGAIAGCAEPRSGPTYETNVGSDGDEAGIDGENRADGSTYTEVYERTIDAVTLVRVFGVDGPTGVQTRGQGSAFLLNDTYAVTNEHVVRGGDEIDFQYVNGDWTTTEVVGTDVYSDLAVLEVDHVPETVDPLSLSEEAPVVGQEVLAIGNPFGLEGSMSRGIVSGVNRSIRAPVREFSFPNVVQTDAAVNPGNSGGPLVDMGGDVVGVVTAGGGDNIGFAISAALTRRVVPGLVEDGVFRHSYVGVSVETVDRVVATANDLPEATGVLVVSVEPDGPAADVLRGREEFVTRHGEPVPVGGDVVLAMDGRPIPDRHALSTFLALETDPGDVVSVELRRDGEVTTVDLELGARPLPE